MERKNNIFQRLKPPCVALSQATLALTGSRGGNNNVTQQLETLKRTLESVASDSSGLDAKIAEYVFFPISQVLKFSQKASIRILELCLQCITILIEKGWRQQLPAQLAGQLVIFCSMLAERNPKNLSFTESTDELQSSALECLYRLFSVIDRDSETGKLLRSEENFPQLGQTISVILDGIEGGRSTEVQIAGTDAFKALLFNAMDTEMQASFLPGIVSKLTKVLSPQTKTRRNYQVLADCLNALKVILRNTMKDDHSASDMDHHDRATSQDPQPQAQGIISKAWHEQAATQLKPALVKIVKLRAHDRSDVRQALGDLCSMILRTCRRTLNNCLYLTLDTLISISAIGQSATTNVELEVLFLSESPISALLQDILYDSLQSIITVMQGTDEQAKSTKMRQINIAYELLKKAGADMTTIDRMLATALRDIVTVTLEPASSKQQSASSARSLVSTDLTVLKKDSGVTEFASPLVQFKGQEDAISSVEEAVRLISSSSSGSSFASDVARALRYSHGEQQIANLWLLLTATKAMRQHGQAIDDLLNFGSEISTACNEYIEQMYSLSLSILADSSDDVPDAKLQALALRALALRAEISGHEFRYDLVDALYPVLHTLATPNEILQRDSIVTLNMFASACGYTSVQDLIVENVDYLTNAVALRLNAFGVSPQAPQVLLMMVRLAGSSLLPYLEDTIESIFAALEDYHGYPLLVELLFKVLGVIADEGVKNPQLTTPDGDSYATESVMVERWRPTTVSSLGSMLTENAEEDQERDFVDISSNGSHPKRPWQELGDDEGDNEEDLKTEEYGNAQMDVSEPPPPAPKTYHILLKIADLTQHFLPSASSSLRASLLSLIATTVPAIARHENSFLPLINTLWPEVVSRLDDEENHIVANALAVVTVFCEHARDFMRSRIIQLWPRLEEIHTSVWRGARHTESYKSLELERSAKHDSSLLQSRPGAGDDLFVASASSATYNDPSKKLLQSTLVACLVAIVRFVQVTPEMIDEALAMLQPSLQEENVRSAFAEESSDALWLMELRTNAVTLPDSPSVPTSVQWHFAKAPS